MTLEERVNELEKRVEALEIKLRRFPSNLVRERNRYKDLNTGNYYDFDYNSILHDGVYRDKDGCPIQKV